MDPSWCLLVLLLLVMVVGEMAERQSDFQIVGGAPVDIETFPWQAALLLDDRFICGAAIVSEFWCLSAAHCVLGASPSRLQLRVGSSEHATGGLTFPVKTVVVHEGFNHSGPYDISALKTSRRLPLSFKVAPAKLPPPGGPDPPPPAPGTEVTVSGWGRTDPHHPDPSDRLRAARVAVAGYSVCREVYGTIELVDALQFCAGAVGREACSGDSGGPVVAEDLLVGLVSYGDLRCTSNLSVYTRVAGHRDWIKQHTGL